MVQYQLIKPELNPVWYSGLRLALSALGPSTQLQMGITFDWWFIGNELVPH